VQEKIDAFRASMTETLSSISAQAAAAVKDAQESVRQLQSECDSAEKRADDMAPKLAEQAKAVDSQIEAYRTQAEAKLAGLEQSLAESVKKTAQLCEAKEADVLKTLDSQLGSYKKDLEYQFSRLETSGKDVDTLEANLRKAMDEIRKRVLADFDTFTTDQQQKHEEFAVSVKTDYDAMEAQLTALGRSIDELKASAVGNVSAKLKDFEDTFDNNLKTRGNKLQEDLTAWKSTFDGKLTLFTTDYENARRALEVKYSEDMQTKLAALQEKNDEQMNRIVSGIKDTQNSVQTQLEDIKQSVDSFTAETQAKVDTSQSAADEYLKKASEEYQKKINEQLGKIQNGLLESLRSFEEAVTNRQETSSSTIDAALSEFNTWKQHLKQQLDESSEMFKNQLETLKTNSQKKITEAESTLAADMSQYSAGVKKQQDDLVNQITRLQSRTDESVASYEKRSEEILGRLQNMYEEMLKDTEERVSRQSADSTQKLNNLKEKIDSVEVANSTNQAKFVLKMQNDSNDIQSRMSELNRELQNVKSQMQVYEKADQMKKQLDEKISNLNEDFARIDAFNQTALKLTDQYNAICRMSEDIGGRFKDFDAQKAKVDSLGQKYDTMINLSNTMDEKISGLQTTYDQLQNMEVTARDFQEKLNAIAGSYDRLEQKQDVIDRVNKDVNTSFDNLKALEERLKACIRQTDSLPQEIKDVQSNVDEIIKSGPRIGDAVSKLSSLQALLDEADKRMDALVSARQGIGRSEARLEELKNDIESKFKLLNQMTKQDLEKHPEKSDERLSPQDRENIKYLKRQGWTIPQIAKRMNRTQTEIEMVLELPDNM